METQVQTFEPDIEAAITKIETFLKLAPDRSMFSRNEINDLCLDMHLLLKPLEKIES